MFYLGHHNGVRLFHARFEAWDYGPIIPELFYKIKYFGDRPIRDVFWHAPPATNEHQREYLAAVAKDMENDVSGRLILLTRREAGGWDSAYSGRFTRIIPDTALQNEYKIYYGTKVPPPPRAGHALVTNKCSAARTSLLDD